MADYVPSTAPKVSVEEALAQTNAVKELKERCREDFYAFSKGVLGYKDLSPKIHLPLCKDLEKIARGTHRFLQVTFPRSWFKSTICSIAFPLWMAVRDPNIRICIAQNTIGNAIKKLREISSHLEKNEMLRALYPEIIPTKKEKWTSEMIEVPHTAMNAEATIEAIGVKGQSTSRHYDLIIEDDTVAPDYDELGTENVAPVKEDIGLAIMWHKLTSSLMVNPGKSANVVVGTRWFENDLISHVKEKESGRFIFHERAVRETDGVPDEHGEITWPERYNEDELEFLETRYGPYMFSCLYMNKPMSSATQTFQLNWFNYYDKPEEDLIVTTTVDPGGDPEDTKGEADFSVVLTTGKSIYTGNIFVLEISCEQRNLTWLINEIFRHATLYSTYKVGVETTAFQKMILPLIREQMKARQKWLFIESITNTRKSKNQRIQGLQPLFSAGKIFLRRHHQALVQQLLSFPNGSHDDMADALSMHLPLWVNTREMPEKRMDRSFDPFDVGLAMAEIEEKNRRNKQADNPVFDVFDPTYHQLDDRFHPIVVEGFGGF